MKVGIDLGGSHIAIGVIDENNFIVEKIERRLMAKDKENIEMTIEKKKKKSIKELSTKYEITEMEISKITQGTKLEDFINGLIINLKK